MALSNSFFSSPGAAAKDAKAAPEAIRILIPRPTTASSTRRNRPPRVCSAEGGGGVGGGTKRYWKGLSAPTLRGEGWAMPAAGARVRVSGLVRVTGARCSSTARTCSGWWTRIVTVLETE